VTNKGRMAIALGSSAAALLLGLGGAIGEGVATAAASSPTPVPVLPNAAGGSDGGATPAHPLGGGGCVIGLNCGCIPRITCPGPRAHPPAKPNSP
jgi:hypothetical protein